MDAACALFRLQRPRRALHIVNAQVVNAEVWRFLLFGHRRSAGEGLAHCDGSPPAQNRKGPLKGGYFGLLVRVEHTARFFLMYTHPPREL